MTKEETIIDVSKQFRNLQVQYDKVVEQNKSLQQELREKTAECEELKKASFVLAEGLNFRQKILDEIEEIAKAKPKKCNHIYVGTGNYCHSGCYEHEYCSEHNILDIIKKVKEGGK